MGLKCVFVASYLFVSCWSQLSLPNEEDFEAYSVAESVYNISSVYFERDFPIFVQAPRNTTDIRYLNYAEKIIQKLQIQNQLSVIFQRGTELRPMIHVKPGSYIIVLPTSITTAELYYIKDMFEQVALHAYNPKGKVVIVNPEEKGVAANRDAFSHFCLTTAWLYNFLQAIFLNPAAVVGLKTDRKTPNFNVYGWTINDQTDLCSGDLDNIRLFDTWLSQEARFSRDSKLFEVDEHLDLKGCKLNVYMESWPPFSWLGPDGKYYGTVPIVLNSFSDLINVRFRFTHDLKIAHIAFPSYYKEETLWPKTYPHIFEKLIWFVPSGSQIPRWQSLCRTFSPFIWFLILLTFTCGTFTIWLLNKSTGQSIFSVFLSSLLTHLGVGVPDRYKGFVATIFFTLWLFYCLIINTAYQSELFRLLVNPGNFPAIQTLKELEESPLIIESLFSISEDKSHWGKFLKQYNKCVNHFECYKKVAIDRTHAIVGTEMNTMEHLYTVRELSDEFGKPKFVQLKEDLGTLYVSLVVRRMSCLFLGLLDNTIQKCISAGLFDFWSSLVNALSRLVFNDRDIIDRFVFSLDHLQGSFILFFLGHLLASFIYIIEIATHFILNYFFLHTITGFLGRVHLF
ncbi:Ionotropic receptor 310 [Blattella germanica]|nr:Ionotropic receptor 310 [Blattella germanica]